MAINLSNLMFTDQDDIVPSSGVEPISVPAYTTINTLAGDDIINGGNNISIDIDIPDDDYSFTNILGTLNTNSGNDLITGIYQKPYGGTFRTGLVNRGTFGPQDYGFATINTGDGNDTITGISKNNDPNDPNVVYGSGLDNVTATIDTGDGNDIITGIGFDYGIYNDGIGIINTDDGNDTITGIASDGYGIRLGTNDFSDVESRIDTGEGDDIITGTGSNAGISNGGTINTGNGKDSIISYGGFASGRMFLGDGDDSIISYGVFSSGEMFLGDGDDSIIADIDFPGRAIQNFYMIDTGYGNDIITSTGDIYNEGVIDTGDGADSIIVDGGIDDITGITYGIYNNGGAIITGNGNDSIITSKGFESGPNSSGAWFLGEGEDYIKGFGSGDFYGGSGNDTLELTPGTYTVGIWGEGTDKSVIFTKGDPMITSEFEKLKAGSTIYDFTSLTTGQIIVVA